MLSPLQRAVAQARQQEGLPLATLLDEQTILNALGPTRALWQAWIYTPAEWRWHNRRVLVVDGSTLTMPDTPENHAEYPQPRTQKRGCGFPIARVVVVFSLAVGTALDAAIGPYKGKQSGENAVVRALHSNVIAKGDVTLVGRYFSGWFDLALLREQGADFVARKHQLRVTDFRTDDRLGRGDQLVYWPKPSRLDWMSPEQYQALPESLTVREVRVQVKQRGFRTRELIVVTSLLSDDAFSAEELGELYRRRWEAELNLRSLKIVLQMDHLRCLMPHRVRNEFYMHLLAYNLIRRTMALAAQEAGVEPWQISFKGTLQTLASFLAPLAGKMPLEAGCRALLASVACHAVGDRPDRFEPRVRKRRPKTFKLMREPRAVYKTRMAKRS